MPNTSQPRLLSFALDDWTVLGDRVSVSLFERVGVLVGRNGAGKSAILEGFEAISSIATGRLFLSKLAARDSIPKKLEIEISTPNERRLGYKYEYIHLPLSTSESNLDDSTSESLEGPVSSWNECCQYIDGEKEVMWSTEDGITLLPNHGDSLSVVLGSTSSLRPSHFSRSSSLKLPDEMQWVFNVLRRVRLLGKTPVRQAYRRHQVFISSKKDPYSSLSGAANSLALKILSFVDFGEFQELEDVCQRIGLGSKITVRKFTPSENSRGKTQDGDEEYISSVLLDGVNIGLLSDGVIRVLSILVDLISSYPSTTTMIEEPETQVHPGLLAKLLNEIATYTFEENLILSTQSPQVVAWANPRNINLVYREHGQTSVRKLQEEEIQKIVEYLYEEGNLGDWLYGGMLDE